MATYIGYIAVPHGSYDQWRSATIGNMYDVDGAWSGQCWDFCALLYWQYGRQLVTKAGGGYAADCWNVSRAVNSQSPFISLTGVENIKRGDILVYDFCPAFPYSHICFADEDYHGGNAIYCFGQNQEGGGYGYKATVNRFTTTGLLGIFRNTNWQGSPSPTPESDYNKDGYNFVLFNRRKRQEKWTKKPLKRR